MSLALLPLEYGEHVPNSTRRGLLHISLISSLNCPGQDDIRTTRLTPIRNQYLARAQNMKKHAKDQPSRRMSQA